MCILLPSDVAVRIIVKHLSPRVANHKPISYLYCRGDLLLISTQHKDSIDFSLFKVYLPSIFASNDPDGLLLLVIKLMQSNNLLVFGDFEVVQLHHVDPAVRVEQLIADELDATKPLGDFD